MEVIGSGFGRTGTSTMKVALEQLGFGPCYHMQEVFGRPSHARAWARLHDDGVDLDAIFHGYRSAVDFPASLLYAEMLERWPHAKVVHTIRAPDRWYASTAETIWPARQVFLSAPLRFLPPIRTIRRMLDHTIWDGLFDGRFADHDHAITIYQRWTEQVMATVPADRLLVFEVSEGWRPLCAFLGVPEPDTPFPRVNDSESFNRRINRLQTLSRVLPATVLLWLLSFGSRRLANR